MVGSFAQTTRPSWSEFKIVFFMNITYLSSFQIGWFAGSVTDVFFSPLFSYNLYRPAEAFLLYVLTNIWGTQWVWSSGLNPGQKVSLMFNILQVNLGVLLQHCECRHCLGQVLCITSQKFGNTCLDSLYTVWLKESSEKCLLVDSWQLIPTRHFPKLGLFILHILLF